MRPLLFVFDKGYRLVVLVMVLIASAVYAVTAITGAHLKSTTINGIIWGIAISGAVTYGLYVYIRLALFRRKKRKLASSQRSV